LFINEENKLTMVSANQYYKNSNSNLPFKEWLKREQLKGKLEIHDNKFLNADGDDIEATQSEQTDVVTENSISCRPLMRAARGRGLIFGLVVGYAICHFIKNKK